MPAADLDLVLRLNLAAPAAGPAPRPPHDAPPLRPHRLHVLGRPRGTPWTAYYQGGAAYSAAKAGVHGFVRDVALELAEHGITSTRSPRPHRHLAHGAEPARAERHRDYSPERMTPLRGSAAHRSRARRPLPGLRGSQLHHRPHALRRRRALRLPVVRASALTPRAVGGGPGSRGDVARVRCPAGTGLHPGARGPTPVGGEAPLDPGGPHHRPRHPAVDGDEETPGHQNSEPRRNCGSARRRRAWLCPIMQSTARLPWRWVGARGRGVLPLQRASDPARPDGAQSQRGSARVRRCPATPGPHPPPLE